MSRKSIIPLEPYDIGGITPRADELSTGEVIGFLKGVNIGARVFEGDDPLLDAYTKFLHDYNNSPIVIYGEDIDIGEADDYFDDVDLNSKISFKSEGLNIDQSFFISNRLWANSGFNSTYMAPHAYLEPTKLSTSNSKSYDMLGSKMTMRTVRHVFQPSILSSMNDLSIRK